MKMNTNRFISNWYLFAIALVTFIFLTEMAIADPLCTNCSVNLVKWALPRAELLMLGWIIAVGNESWMARSKIVKLLRHLRFTGRNSRNTPPSNAAEPKSSARAADSATA